MNPPRVLIAGTSSGCGKTSAVCAVLTLLRRGYPSVRACKCGPDYIDPMFHTSVLGIPSTNLDPFFCGENLLRALLCENAGEDITVIEGVMGYYDGTGENGTDNSAYTVARRTGTPVILVADAKGSAASLLAVVEGFVNYMPDSCIRGVLFNRMSTVTYENIRGLMNWRFGDSIFSVGFIPEFPEEYRVPSRHLGLVTAGEIDGLTAKINAIADICADTVDIDAIMSIARSAEDITYTAPEIIPREPVHIAYARDAAFCFYYSDTLRLFERMGAVLEPFSPLADEPVPSAADGLLLGGGYPELYAERLAKNTTVKYSISRAVRGGMPTIAECGGFQYLGKTLDGRDMCGVLPHDSAPAGRLVRFGYITLTAREDGLLGPAGTVLRGHEFHYWDSTENGSAFEAVKPNGKSWLCGVTTPTLYAGYPHLYLYASIPAAETFYGSCLEYSRKKQGED